MALGPPDFQGSPGAHRTPRDVRCSSGRRTLPPGRAICTDGRSAGLAPRVLQRPPRPPTHRGPALAPTAGYRSRA
ncbi:unnamed protein product [Prunus brigantina]